MVARPAGLRRADQLHEGVTEALVPRGLPVGGDLVRPGLEAGPGLGEGLGGQLHAHGAERLVEAQEAPLVLGAPGGRRPVRALRSGRRRPALAPSAPWPRRRAPQSVSGVATSASALTLSKDTSPAHSEPTRWGRSQAFSPTWSAPGRSGSRPRSAPRPRARSTSPPRRGRPGAGWPRPRAPRSSPRRRPSGERPVETRRRSPRWTGRRRLTITSAPAAWAGGRGHRGQNGPPSGRRCPGTKSDLRSGSAVRRSGAGGPGSRTGGRTGRGGPPPPR